MAVVRPGASEVGAANSKVRPTPCHVRPRPKEDVVLRLGPSFPANARPQFRPTSFFPAIVRPDAGPTAGLPAAARRAPTHTRRVAVGLTKAKLTYVGKGRSSVPRLRRLRPLQVMLAMVARPTFLT